MAVPERQLVVLVVDDDRGDVLLIEEALERSGQVQVVHVAGDGYVAFLRRTGQYADVPRPDVILLDLNVRWMDGRQVLAEIKADPLLLTIPVLVFSTSQDPHDIATSYHLHANAYVTKPVNLEDFGTVIAQISEFFAQIVALPTAS
jgi:CheY-like chemotaxis protein